MVYPADDSSVDATGLPGGLLRYEIGRLSPLYSLCNGEAVRSVTMRHDGT